MAFESLIPVPEAAELPWLLWWYEISQYQHHSRKIQMILKNIQVGLLPSAIYVIDLYSYEIHNPAKLKNTFQMKKYFHTDHLIGS